MLDQNFQHDIFMSYARADRDRVKLMASTLESLGWSVWWDRRIPTGKRFAKVIEEQLEASRTIVVVWSNKSIESHWVHTEAAEGLSRDVLFPILIDKVRIPLEFKRVQAADLTSWQGDQEDDQWKSLIDDLASVLGSPGGSSQSTEIKDQETPQPSSATKGKPKPVPMDKRTSVSEWKPTPVPMNKSAGAPMDKRRTKPRGKPTSPLREKRRIPNGMVLVPKGSFLYGDEKETVVLDHDYYMDIHPVTNAAYAKFIQTGGYGKESYWSQEGWKLRKTEKVTEPAYWKDDTFNQPDHPVVGVSYYEAEAYAKWAEKRLPTEQEWEKAARGTDGRDYPWGEEFNANMCANSVKGKRERTTPIGTFPEGQSPSGCQDMAGNVWEWCASWYDKDKDMRGPAGRVLGRRQSRVLALCVPGQPLPGEPRLPLRVSVCPGRPLTLFSLTLFPFL